MRKSAVTLSVLAMLYADNAVAECSPFIVILEHAASGVFQSVEIVEFSAVATCTAALPRLANGPDAHPTGCIKRDSCSGAVELRSEFRSRPGSPIIVKRLSLEFESSEACEDAAKEVRKLGNGFAQCIEH